MEVQPADHTPAPKPTDISILSPSRNLSSTNPLKVIVAEATVKIADQNKRTQSESGIPDAKKRKLDIIDENNSISQYEFMREAQNLLNNSGMLNI